MKKNRPHKIFDKLLKDLSSVRPSSEEEILCPMCLKQFSREDIVSGRLSEEHMIPKSLGGRDVTLTCKACNNQDGTEIDSHLVKKTRIDDAFAGYGTVPMTVEVAGHKMTTEVQWKLDEEQQTTIQVIGKASNPEAWPAAKQALRNQHHSIHMSWQASYSLQRSKLALVRIAYLAMFHHFGYQYILSTPLEIIRDAIRTRQDDTIVPRMVLTISNISPPPEVPVIITPVKKEATVHYYLLIVRLVSERVVYHGVVMPPSTPGGESIYDEFEDYRRPAATASR